MNYAFATLNLASDAEVGSRVPGKPGDFVAKTTQSQDAELTTMVLPSTSTVGF
jgi:hypothetical protein